MAVASVVESNILPRSAKALIDARKRGVKIDVGLDKSQRSEKYSSADYVSHAGIPVHIHSKHKIAHNKIMILDQNTLITGSFNFTKSPEESKTENLLILKGNKPGGQIFPEF
jgi:phosphatidylserine/phosphatidylglycerophosphate/cardiolipin synthase-like enzyme